MIVRLSDDTTLQVIDMTDRPLPDAIFNALYKTVCAAIPKAINHTVHGMGDRRVQIRHRQHNHYSWIIYLNKLTCDITISLMVHAIRKHFPGPNNENMRVGAGEKQITSLLTISKYTVANLADPQSLDKLQHIIEDTIAHEAKHQRSVDYWFEHHTDYNKAQYQTKHQEIQNQAIFAKNEVTWPTQHKP